LHGLPVREDGLADRSAEVLDGLVDRVFIPRRAGVPQR
jgi:hypothetical protein